MSSTIKPVTVVIVNESTAVTDQQVACLIQALEIQLDEDYSPSYGVPVVLKQILKGAQPDPGQWQLAILDNSDQAGALGYHETTIHGDPIGFAFAKSAIEDGESWTVTASHELLEMLADPEINSSVEVDNSDGTITMHFKEICDPCEDDQYAYSVSDGNGDRVNLPDGSPVLVSDFVLPGYWNPNVPAGTKLDRRGHITAPLQVLSGGYTSVLNVPSSVQWQQITERRAGAKLQREVAKPFGRRFRHATNKNDWKRSER